MAQTREQNASEAHTKEAAAAIDAEAGLPFAAAAAFRTPNGSAAVTTASPGEMSQTQTSITKLPDGTTATTVVTTTTVTTTTTTTTTTQTFITGEIPPVMLHQLEAAPAVGYPSASPAGSIGPVGASSSSPARPAVQAIPASVASTTADAAPTTYAKPLGYRFVKRLLDIVFSAAVIVLGFIPGLILSLAIMISTKGSPFYVQKRVKKGGEEFNIYKFRTMVADADNLEKHLSPEQLKEWHAEHKVENDPRITPLGSFLRRTSIDEFPNFLNVFAGQMSVVGPRAITKEELDWFGDDRAKLLSVPAGVTGWWQVSSRNESTFESGDRQKLELYYVDHASLGMDIRIFFKTFAAVFTGTGQ